MIDQYIKQYGKRLYGLCVTLCTNTFDADDLYQETWLKVVKSIDQYDPSKDFEPWLTRICVNTYRNVVRRRSVISVVEFQTTEDKDA
ncbi:MAG: sigma-70 family RNA polymerase sigma factor, partial [Ruminococcaceae bacterium]|nr:sigma-70 family RNA polymerase sigma factor [Oscillospiraceae bacterium]